MNPREAIACKNPHSLDQTTHDLVVCAVRCVDRIVGVDCCVVPSPCALLLVGRVTVSCRVPVIRCYLLICQTAWAACAAAPSAPPARIHSAVRPWLPRPARATAPHADLGEARAADWRASFGALRPLLRGKYPLRTRVGAVARVLGSLVLPAPAPARPARCAGAPCGAGTVPAALSASLCTLALWLWRGGHGIEHRAVAYVSRVFFPRKHARTNVPRKLTSVVLVARRTATAAYTSAHSL